MRRRVSLLSAVVGVLAADSYSLANSLQIIGSGQDFQPSALSADGSTLVGSGQDGSGNAVAMHWTQAGGLSFLGTPSEYPSLATGVSGNGSVIIGYNENTSTYVYTPWEWTASGGYQYINVPGYTNAYPTSITPDASEIGLVGIPTLPLEGYPRSFVDNTSTGFTVIPYINIQEAPNGIILSPDGKTAFGATFPNYNGYAWFNDFSYDIPLVPGTTSYNIPEAITGDDSTIFGEVVNTGNPNVVFIYDATKGVSTAIGMPDPGSVPATPDQIPLKMSVTSDGRILVGTEVIKNPSNAGETENYPWVWTSAGGFESLQSFLSANGVNIGSYNLFTVDGISGDGTILYGSGFSIGAGTEHR